MQLDVVPGRARSRRRASSHVRLSLLLAVWSVALVAGTLAIVNQAWIRPLRTQLKGVNIASYDHAYRINGLENVLATSPLIFRSSRDMAALREIEGCVDGQIATVKASYDRIRSAYDSCAAAMARFLDRFRLSFSEPEQFGIFVTPVSSRLGRYGPSIATDPAQIARDPVLNCTQTMIFVARTIKRYYPAVEVREIGIDNQALGEHGFVEMTSRGRSILLDGLVGLVADISLAEATAGARPRPFLMVDFFDETQPNLRTLSEGFMRTLRLGGLSQRDIAFARTVAAPG